ncbi:MAG: hypothetical protein ACFB10_17285 [Salibacteraceae bacterium]
MPEVSDSSEGGTKAPATPSPDSAEAPMAPFQEDPRVWDQSKFPPGLGAPPRIDEDRRFDVSSGTITYTLSGVDLGTETLYFKDFGVYEAHHFQMANEVRPQIEIMTPDWIYHSNPLGKAPNSVWESANMEGPLHLGWLSRSTLISGGMRLVGYEELLGHSCKVWEEPGSGTKTWTWRYLVLRSEIPVKGGKRIKVATSVEVGTKVDDKWFQIPEAPPPPPPEKLRGLMDRLNTQP